MALNFFHTAASSPIYPVHFEPPLFSNSLNMSQYHSAQNLDKRIAIIPKTISEVAGERILRPLIDSIIYLSSKCFQQAQDLYKKIPALPSLLPVVSAQGDCDLGDFESNDGQMTLLYSSKIFSSSLRKLLSKMGVNKEEISLILKQSACKDKIFEKVLQLNTFSEEVINHQFWMTAVTSEGYNLPHYLIEYGTPEQAQQWISSPIFNKTLLDTTNNAGQTPLHTVAINGCVQLYPYLDLRHLGSFDQKGLTPIHYAIHENQLHFLEFMYNNRRLTAKQCTYERNGYINEFYVAVAAGHPTILDFLIEKKIVILNKSALLQSHKELGTVFHLAIRNQKPQMLHYLLHASSSYWQSILEITHKGCNPLQLAAHLDDSEMFKMLVYKENFINSHASGDIKSILLNYLEDLKKNIQYQPKDIQNFTKHINHLITQEASKAQEKNYYNIPDPLQFFTGREEELVAIEQAFWNSSKVAISSLGGEGKSTLSMQYAAMYKTNYTLIAGVSAINEGTIKQSLKELAAGLGIKINQQEEVVLLELKSKLQMRTTSYLIIIDGLNDSNLFQVLESYLPQNENCKILITTRMQSNVIDRGYKCIFLQPFSEKDALDYLFKVANMPFSNEEVFFAKKVSAAVGNLPLALTYIVRYINYMSKPSFKKYNTLFEKHHFKLLGEPWINLLKEKGEKSIFTVWSISIDEIKTRIGGELANDLLQLVALLAEGEIPLSQLQKWIHLNYPDKDESYLNQAILLILDHSLINYKKLDGFSYYSMHSLLKDVIKFSMNIQEKNRVIFNAWKMLSLEGDSLIKDEESTQKQLFIQSNHLQFFFKNYYNILNINKAEKLRFSMQLGEIFFKISQNIRALTILEEYFEDKGVNLDLVNLYLVAAEVYLDIGNNHRALELGDQALNLIDKLFNQNGCQKKINHTKNESSFCRRQNREFINHESIEILDLAIEQSAGKEKALNALLVKCYNILANTFVELSKYQEALKYAKYGLSLQEQPNSGFTDKDLAISYDLISWILRSLGRLKEACEYGEKSLQIRIKIGEKSPIAESYDSVAWILRDLGKNNKSLTYAHNALQIRLSLGGREDYIASSYDNKARSLMGLGNHIDALEQANKGRMVREKNPDEESRYTAVSYNLMAMILEKIGKYDLAKDYGEKGLRIRERAEIDKPHAIAYHLVVLARVLIEKDIQSALNHAKKAFQIRGQLEEKDYVSMADCYHLFAQIFFEKNMSKADRFAKQALELRKNIFGELSPFTAASYQLSNEIKYHLGENKQALEQINQSLVLHREIFDSPSPISFLAYYTQGEILCSLGDIEGAYRSMENSLEHQQKKEYWTMMTAKTYQKAGMYLEKLQRLDEAKKYFEYQLMIENYIKNNNFIFHVEKANSTLFKSRIKNNARQKCEFKSYDIFNSASKKSLYLEIGWAYLCSSYFMSPSNLLALGFICSLGYEFIYKHYKYLQLEVPRNALEQNQDLIPQALMPFIKDSFHKFVEQGAKSRNQLQPFVKIDQVKKALKCLGLQEEEIQKLSTECSHKVALLIDQCFDRLLSGDHGIKWDDLDKDLFIPLRNSEGLSLLGAAVQRGAQEKTESILQKFQDTALVYAQDFFGRDVLHIAAMEGKSALIPLLINRGIGSVKSKDKGGFTPLHWAIQKGDTASTLELATRSSLRDAWVNPYTGDRYSPLAFAVMRGDIAILETLIQSDRLKQLNFLEQVSNVGNVLHLAIQCNKSDMLAHLLQEKYGKTLELLEITDPTGRTPLQLAAFLGDLYAIRYLYEQYTRLNEGDLEAGGTAVHYAVKGGKPEAIQLLDYLGASLVSPDDEGRAPLALLSSRQDLTPQEMRCKNLLETLPRMNRTAKTAPPTYIRRPPLNLVFQGGGPKGYAYLGVLKALEDPEILASLRKSEGIGSTQGNNSQNLMVEVRRVAGTSAGAIIAALLAVGYNAKELEDPLNKDFFELLDFQGELEKQLFQSVQDGSKASAIKALLGAYWKTTYSLNLISPVKELFHQLSSTTELCTGNELLQWVESLIKAKTKKDNCTFGELKDLVRRSPVKYKHLHIFSLKVNTGSHSEVVRFSSEDDNWKDLIIADAVRASSSIPGVFTPYHLRFKNSQGKPNEDKSYGQFVDGGLAQKFPIEAFDDEKFQEDPYFVGQKTNRRTMGFSLIEAGDHEPETPSSLDSIKTAKELMKAVASTYFHAEEIIQKIPDTSLGRVVQVKIKGVKLLDFNMSEEKKKEMEKSGKKAVEVFFGLKSSQGELVSSSRG